MATKADIDRWIAGQGGPDAVSYGYEDIQVDNPAADPMTAKAAGVAFDPTAPAKITTRRETWTNKQTGAVYSAVRTPYKDDELQDVKETPGTKTPAQTGTSTTAPRVPAGSVPQIEGTPIRDASGKITGYDNSQPIRVWHAPDGSLIYDPLNPQEVQQWQSAQGQTGEVRKPVDGRPGWTSVTRATTQNGNKTETTVYIGPDGKETSTLPAQPTVTLREDGQGNVVAVSVYPDGRVESKPTGITGKPTQVTVDGTVYERGADGVYKPAAGLPQQPPSNPKTPGPTLPQIVLGHSQEAARQYLAALQQGVASGQWSQAWADSRWKEFMETANLAVSEAATQQREQESTRNAQINVAQSRATYASNAQKDALSYADKINGLAPPGSSLGGQAFATMMGLSMLMEARSGLSSVNTQAALPTVTPATLGNPSALTAAQQAVNSQVQAAAQPSAQNAGGGTGEPPARANVPAQPAATASSASRPTGTTAAPASAAPASTAPPDNRPDQTQVGSQIDNAIMPPQADAPAYAKPEPSDMPPGYTPDYGQPGMRVLPQPESQPQAQDAAPASYGASGDTMNVDGGVTPATGYPVMPYNPDPDQGPVGMAQQPPGGYAVLQPYMQQQTQPSDQQQQSPQPQQADQGTPLALLHAQAAIREPWRMSAEDVQRYRDAGVPDSVIFGMRRSVA